MRKMPIFIFRTGFKGKNFMISPEKARRFMWFSLGISLSLIILYGLQKLFGGGE
jgi:hypothetical protein